MEGPSKKVNSTDDKVSKASAKTKQSTKVVELIESDANVFSFIYEWLYAQDIKQKGDIRKIGEDEECALTALMYIDIWKLADYLLMPELQNKVMTRLYETFPQEGVEASTYELYHLIKPCYEGTLPGAPLRSWISHLFALGLAMYDPESLAADVSKHGSEDFFLDFFIAKHQCLTVVNAGPLTVEPKGQGACGYTLEVYLVEPLEENK